METTLRFGELIVDSLYVAKDGGTYRLETEWGPEYSSAREAAEKAIKAFGLSEDDFWIAKELSPLKDKIVYTNLVPRHAACEKINKLLKPELQFDISCITEARGSADGTVCFIYKSEKQGLFEVGEANRYNAGNYLYSAAKRRVFDKVVIKNTGLYGDNIAWGVGEDEIKTPAPAVPAGIAAQPQMQTIPETRKRLDDIRKVVAFLGVDINKLLTSYGVFSLEEMDEDDLSDCEAKLKRKLQKKRAAIKASEAQSAQQAATQSGISSIAAEVLGQANAGSATSPQQAVVSAPTPVPIGQTVYECSPNAPEAFRKLSGQTFDQIGLDLLRGLYRRQNAAGRKYVSPALLDKIEEYIA